jgi:hypothetical protein
MSGRPVESPPSYWKAGNFSTENRPTQENLPLVALRMAIGRVVSM